MKRERKINSAPSNLEWEIMNHFNIIRIIAAIVIALTVIFAIIFFVSDDPGNAISMMIFGPLQSKRSLFNVIERSLPLIFTGLAMNVVLQGGVFNIGQDGAFYMGAVIAAFIALKLPLPPGIHPAVAIIVSAVTGGIISTLPVWLQKYTKVNSVVLAIMFNSIFYYVGLAIVSNFLLEKSGSWGSNLFPASAKLGRMIPGTNMHWGVLILFFVYIFVVVLMKKSSFGFKLKAVGKNPELAKNAGIKVGTVLLLSQFIGGAISGAGGAIEMLGIYQRFLWQGQVSYVWDGLMIHMLANGNPKYIPITAIFIAYLRVGSEIMSRATKIAPEVISFLQGIVIVMIASERFLYVFKRKYEHKVSLRNAEMSKQEEARG